MKQETADAILKDCKKHLYGNEIGQNFIDFHALEEILNSFVGENGCPMCNGRMSRTNAVRWGRLQSAMICNKCNHVEFDKPETDEKITIRTIEQ